MPSVARVTLDQWQALIAVVETGTYAKAAHHLHKTQSAVTYAVEKLESLLAVKVFEIKGRKAVLTPTGDLLYHLGDRAASVRPYILGGLGVYNADFGGAGNSSTKFAFGFGGGILFGIGTMHAFLEGRYISVQTSGSSLNFVPISLGIMFGQ